MNDLRSLAAEDPAQPDEGCKILPKGNATAHARDARQRNILLPGEVLHARLAGRDLAAKEQNVVASTRQFIDRCNHSYSRTAYVQARNNVSYFHAVCRSDKYSRSVARVIVCSEKFSSTRRRPRKPISRRWTGSLRRTSAASAIS